MSLQNIEKLNDPEMIEKFNQIVENIVAADDVKEAKELIAFLSDIFSHNPEFNKVKPALYNIYNKYLIAAKFVIIFDLEDEEIFDLIRENFGFVLDYPGYDIERKMNYKIRRIIGLEKRDIFKKEINRTLLKCNTILSKNKILINEQKHTPTVGNWLKDYYIKVGMEKVDALKLTEYFVYSSNIKLLSPEELIKLKRLLDFFENMKILSTKFPMSNESFVAILPSGEISLMSEKKIEITPPNILKLYNEVKNITNQENKNFDDGNEARINELKQLASQYPAGSFERKAVEEEIGRITREL